MPSFGEFARGVGRGLLNTAQGVGRAVGAIPRQIGYEIGQYGRGLRNVVSGDFASAAQNFMGAQGAPVMRDAFMSAFNDDPSGSVVGRGYIGGRGRGGGASRAAGHTGQRQIADRAMSGVARGARETPGATNSQDWIERAPARAGGLLRGQARLGSTQMLGSEVSLREHMAAQQRRPDQER